MQRLNCLTSGSCLRIYIICSLCLIGLGSTCFAQTELIDDYRKTILKQNQEIEKLEYEILNLNIESFKQLYEQKQKLLNRIQKLRKWGVRLSGIARGCCSTPQSQHHLEEMMKEIKSEIDDLVKEYKKTKLQLDNLKKAIRENALGGG